MFVCLFLRLDFCCLPALPAVPVFPSTTEFKTLPASLLSWYTLTSSWRFRIFQWEYLEILHIFSSRCSRHCQSLFAELKENGLEPEVKRGFVADTDVKLRINPSFEMVGPLLSYTGIKCSKKHLGVCLLFSLVCSKDSVSDFRACVYHNGSFSKLFISFCIFQQ